VENQTLFAEILLPLPLPGYFTYRVPAELNEVIRPGIRVVVPFGSKKIYSGLVRSVSTKPPIGFQAKYLSSVLDENPIVFESQFRFWEWIAQYYMCSVGEVMNAALPAALKLAGETKVILNPNFDGDIDSLNENEFLVVDALTVQKSLTISEVSKITRLQKTLPLIANLIEKHIISLSEDLHNSYQPKVEKFLRITPAFEPEEKLKEAFDYAQSKAPRQLEVLIAIIKLSGRYQANSKDVSVQNIKTIVKNPEGSILSLVRKGILEYYTKKVSRFDHGISTSTKSTLSEDQQSALENIKLQWGQKDVVLLHGVTSSGKTEIYIELIRDCLAQGKQVLYLLPEIALTTQIIIRIQQRFGDLAGVYHSKFNALERTEVWNNLALGGVESMGLQIKYQLVVGPRSALFLPYQNLGLVIVDEEHDPSYKQQEPAPRYNARDAAIWLAKSLGAKVLLGSATPSVESYYNAQIGKYSIVSLSKRYGGIQMPEILVADIKKEARQKTMKSHFSSILVNSLSEALDNKKQVILFQNRRGFSTRLECDQCNWIPMCLQCDVSLVYHKHIHKLKCHYCGYSVAPPSKCSSCGSTGIALKGFGTEKIEEELPLLFPRATIARLDLDTTRAKNAFQKILDDFGEKKIDVLIGTQMVSKGLDFDNVGVVGILSADSMLSYPDFRAHERAFQMMAQVSGRAGRKNSRGQVIIQALDPLHTIILQVIDNDFEGMYKNQILERRNFRYPPFYRLIILTVSHIDPQKVNKASDYLAVNLKKLFGKDAVLGPEFPIVAKIKGQYLKNTILKMSYQTNFQKQKEELRKLLDEFGMLANWKTVRVKINVDP